MLTEAWSAHLLICMLVSWLKLFNYVVDVAGLAFRILEQRLQISYAEITSLAHKCCWYDTCGSTLFLYGISGS